MAKYLWLVPASPKAPMRKSFQSFIQFQTLKVLSQSE